MAPAAAAAPPDESRPIDLVHLSRQTLGDRDLEIELLSLFERQADHILRQIAAMGPDGDRRLRHDLAHTLKGSARAVGAKAVAARAEAYEECLSAQADGARTAAAQDALQQAVDAARAAVLALLSDQG